MFMSLTNSFSIQAIDPNSGSKMPWIPIKDKSTLIKSIKEYVDRGWFYRVAGVNYLGNAIMVTHKYCEKMVWGFKCFGRGIKS
jgi:hypothetical protein